MKLPIFGAWPPASRSTTAQPFKPARPGGAHGGFSGFLAWAAGYDDSSPGGTRTIANHSAWLGRFACPVLELRGDLTVAERVAAVLAKVQTL